MSSRFVGKAQHFCPSVKVLKGRSYQKMKQQKFAAKAIHFKFGDWQIILQAQLAHIFELSSILVNLTVKLLH